MNYAVHIVQRLSEPHHLAGYAISIVPTDEAPTETLTANRTVVLDRHVTTGVFAELRVALTEIRRAICLPFSVHANAGSDYADYVVLPVDAPVTEYSRRIATAGRAPGRVVMHEAMHTGGEG